MIEQASERPRLLDLYSCAGGAAVGYHRAGFYVTGVDIDSQPNYPFDFVQADALEVLRNLDWLGRSFDAIHASPPCQRYVRSGMYDRSEHPDLLPPTRELLERTGLPYVIENVPGAPMRADYKLCGCMFGLPDLKRERWFETSWHGFDMRQPCHHAEPVMGVYGHPRGGKQGETWGWGTFADWQRGMGIDWMTADELREAIPPAYTEFIGRQLIEHCRQTPLEQTFGGASILRNV